MLALRHAALLPCFASLPIRGGLRLFSVVQGHVHRRVVVTGVGLVTPLGADVASSWSGILSGKTGVRRLYESDLPEVMCTSRSWFDGRDAFPSFTTQAHRGLLPQLPSQVVAPVCQKQLSSSVFYPQDVRLLPDLVVAAVA
jgi:hypothetical protein